MKLIQISDFHLLRDPAGEYREVQPEQRFDQVCRHILEHHHDADGLLLTGDHVQQPTRSVYRRLQHKLAALSLPWCTVPGNHDDAVLNAELLADGADLPVLLQQAGWNLVMLDSNGCVDGYVGAALGAGALAATELDYLSQCLQKPGPQLVVLHHNPFPLCDSWQQSVSLQNADEFVQRLHASGREGIVLCGHVHQAWERVLAPGWRALSCPATSAQFRKSSPEVVVENRLPEACPGYRCLQLQQGGDVKSHVEYVRPGY